MLPQKKNPDAAELARAKAPRLTADLAGLLGVVAGLPLAYNKDLQEDKEYLFDAIDTVDLLLPALAGMVSGATFRADRMRAAVSGRVPRGDRPGGPPRHPRLAVPPRARGRRPAGAGVHRRADRAREAGPAEFAAAGLEGVELPPLTAEASVEAKRAPGGTARQAVADQLAAARARVAAW